MADDLNVETWLGEFQVSTSDMNRLVMDYLITEGYKEAAEKFSEEANVHYPNNAYSESLDARIQIRLSIQEGRLRDAITMVNDLQPELLDDNKYLYFHLLQQELIELIRNDKVEEALNFAQANLAEKGEENPKILNELERTLALLAFENPEKSPFGDLLNVAQRFRVASETNAALLEAEHRPSAPKLESLVQLVLWAQDQLDKKNVSYPKMIDVAGGAIQCPKVKQN